jgi:hypothetical protein
VGGLGRMTEPVGALREDAAAKYLGVGVTTFRTFNIPRVLLPGDRGAVHPGLPHCGP